MCLAWGGPPCLDAYETGLTAAPSYHLDCGPLPLPGLRKAACTLIATPPGHCLGWLARSGCTTALRPTGPWGGQPGRAPHLPPSGIHSRAPSTSRLSSSAPPPMMSSRSSPEPTASCHRYSTFRGERRCQAALAISASLLTPQITDTMHCIPCMAVSHLWSLNARSRTCTMLSMGRLKCFAMQLATSITVRSFCVPML